MKKILISLFMGLLITTSLSLSGFSSLTSTVDAKELKYKVTLRPGETYQLGNGSGYKYIIMSGDKEDFTISSSGIIKIGQYPNNIGYAGFIYVVDRFDNIVESVDLYIKY